MDLLKSSCLGCTFNAKVAALIKNYDLAHARPHNGGQPKHIPQEMRFNDSSMGSMEENPKHNAKKNLPSDIQRRHMEHTNIRKMQKGW